MAAVKTFTGRWTERTYLEQLAELRTAVEQAGLEVSGPPRFARFDPPMDTMVPPSQRGRAARTLGSVRRAIRLTQASLTTAHQRQLRMFARRLASVRFDARSTARDSA